MRKFYSILSIALFTVLLLRTNAIATREVVIRIGINAPLTGDIPKVGESSKYAAMLWLEDIEKNEGLEVGGKRIRVEIVLEDNESKAESAVKANTKLITQDDVLLIVGPQSSKQAVPAGEVANIYKTPMISPWSTNPNTTIDRPYVFRVSFIDEFQALTVVNFIGEEFGFTKAAVLYDVASDYPKNLAELFKAEWEKKYGAGSIVAYENFKTKDTDFSSQLHRIIKSGAQVLFSPQYHNEVAKIVHQAKDLGWKGAIIGSDSWGSEETVELCGEACYGLYFSTHFATVGAKGEIKTFIERYQKKYGDIPDDVAALTWDTLLLAQRAIQDTGEITGRIEKDRMAVRESLAKIKDFSGITGNMTFTGNGDPMKCGFIVKINRSGEYELYKSECCFSCIPCCK